jgi:N-acetylmuramoyl-L-alanine amidase
MLLLGSASAAAGALLREPAALASRVAAPAPARIGERAVGDLRGGVSRIDLARNADLLALRWRSPRDARVEVSFRDARGRWSAWVPAAAAAHGPDGGARGARADVGVSGEPVWAGGTHAIAVRSDRSLSSVRLHLIDVSDGLGAHRLALATAALAHAAALPLAHPTLVAGAGQPPIIARRAWAWGSARPRVAPAYGAVRLAFVHHTENPNGYLRGEVPAMLRAIFAFHAYVNGWDDIGYNFAIDAFGRIFEARAGGIDEPVIGAQAGGYNYASTGIAILGSFERARISRAAHASLARLLAWKLSLHGVGARGHTVVKVNPAGAVWSKYRANALVPLPSIAGHRDADATDCPGDALYAQLPGIRARVHALAPRPTLATLALVVPAPGGEVPATSGAGPAPNGETLSLPAEAPSAPGALTFAGTVSLLDGVPVAGAVVSIQMRVVGRRGESVSERTLASVQSDADGAFTATLVPPSTDAKAIALRALYLGGAVAGASAGAAVSAPVSIGASAPPQPAMPAAPATPGAPGRSAAR